MKNKKLALVIAAVLTALTCTVITAGFSCSFFNKTTITDVAERLKRDWDIILPEDAELIYYNKDLGFTGDGFLYYVIKFEEEPFELTKSFFYGPDDAFEYNFEFVVRHINVDAKKEIPSDYMPDWQLNYQWKRLKNDSTSDSLWLLYNQDNLALRIIFSI